MECLMKNYRIGLLTLAICAAFSACTDEYEDRELVITTRPFNTEISDSEIGTTTWDAGPYYIPEDLTISSGATLTIAAGVDVYFGPRASLFIEGTLIASGNVDNNIRFLPINVEEDYGLWQSIVFKPTSTNSRMDYCFIAFGGKFNNEDPNLSAAVVIDDCNPIIEHSMIYLNQYNGILLRHGAVPSLHSNIIFKNDGSGIVFEDSTHVGSIIVLDGIPSGEMISYNCVANNSSLDFRFSSDFKTMQWPDPASLNGIDDTQVYGSEILAVDPDTGEETPRYNENNDKIDAYFNTIQLPDFDQLTADIQELNPCSPCIGTAADFRAGSTEQRTEIGPVYYDAAPFELRKLIRIDGNLIQDRTYVVKCEAFAPEPLTIINSRIEFAGNFGLVFEKLDATDTEFVLNEETRAAGLDRWRSILINSNSYGPSYIDGCTFSDGSESGYAGDNYIRAGGLLEMNEGAVVEVTNSSFINGQSNGITANGSGTTAIVDNCTFENIAYSAYYLANGGRGKLSNSEVVGTLGYGVYIFESPYLTQIENNVIRNGELFAIKLEASPNVEILQNTIMNNGYGGIRLAGNSDPLISRNVIINNDDLNSDRPTGIIGLSNDTDTNRPMIDMNLLAGNGGDDISEMPSQWEYGCNSIVADPTDIIGGSFTPGNEVLISDCNGGEISIGYADDNALSNPGPLLASLGDHVLDEDNAYDVYLTAISFDGNDDFTFSIELSNTDHCTYEIDSLQANHLLVYPEANWIGETDITVTADNGVGFDSETASLEWTAVNDGPVIEDLEAVDLVLEEGEVLEPVFTLTAIDVENDYLVFGGVAVFNDGTLDVCLEEYEIVDENCTFDHSANRSPTTDIVVSISADDVPPENEQIRIEYWVFDYSDSAGENPYGTRDTSVLIININPSDE
jgi:parallel beta-helix repeat protein